MNRRYRGRRSAPYSVAVLDPGWDFKDKLPGPGRGAAKHYKTSPVQLMVDYVLSVIGNKMADDCVLALWRVAAMQYEALEMLRLLDFKLKSEIVWLKLTKSGKRHFGMGHQVRMEHEVCLLATRGKNIRINKSIRSAFTTDDSGLVFEAEAERKHSKKPQAFFDIMDRLYGGRKIELFARDRRPGWDANGWWLDTYPIL